MLAIALGLLSGLLLFASDYPWHLLPLGAVALVPVLFALARGETSLRRGALAGGAVGFAYTLPLGLVLQFPPLLALALGAYIALTWAIWGALAARVLRWPAPWNALAVAAIAVVIEATQTMLVPMWGTAQSFVRVWSAAPGAIQFVAATGINGVVFVVVALQALVVELLLGPRRRATAVALVVLLATCTTANLILWNRDAGKTVRVAALGWTFDQLEERGATTPALLLEKVYQPLLDQAVADGATLVVSPETAFVLPAGEVSTFLARFGALAHRHQVALAVGYFHQGERDNRIALFDAAGTLRGEYKKTHLIPFFEEYTAGDGTLVVETLDNVGAPVGGMICQDDNFTDLARAYGREEVGLVVVPTNDWREVRNYHFENSRFRPLENHYAVVRASSNGVSAVVAPNGAVIAQADHFETGPTAVVADVPLGSGATLYSAAGEWFAVFCLLALVGAVYYRRWVSRARATTQSPAPPPAG